MSSLEATPKNKGRLEVFEGRLATNARPSDSPSSPSRPAFPVPARDLDRKSSNAILAMLCSSVLKRPPSAHLQRYLKMGCERVPEPGNSGFGGVRASMERRWLINAKTTVMRQRKWHEVRLQKELDEQRKKADILERRKRERARLSAYIYSAMQPPVKCSTVGKHRRNDRKTLDWNTCLLRDQELIFKLREDAKAVMHDHRTKGGSSNSDQAVPQRYTCRTAYRDSGHVVQVSATPSRSGRADSSLKRNPDDSMPLLEVPATGAEAITLNPRLKKDSHRDYQMTPPPSTRSVISDVGVNTSGTWARNIIPREIDVAENHQSPSMLEMSNWRSSTAHMDFDKHDGSQLERTVLPKSRDPVPGLATEIAGCPDSVEKTVEFASLEIASLGTRESVVRRNSPDLREEILRSRLVNEAATTRLIAQVTAIESRLDDCNMNWKSLSFRDDQVEMFPATCPTQSLCANVYPAYVNLVSNRQFSLDTETGPETARGDSSNGTKVDHEDFVNAEGQQSADHVRERRFFLSSPRVDVSNDISIDSTVSGSFLINKRVEINHRGQGNTDREGVRQDLSTNRGTTDSQERKITSIGLSEQMNYRPGRSSVCHESGPETSASSSPVPVETNNSGSIRNFSHQGDAEREERQPCPLKIIGNPSDISTIEPTYADSMEKSHAAWNIDWNAATDHFPCRSWEDLQSRQSRGGSGMPKVAHMTSGGEQSSQKSRVPYCVSEPGQQKLSSFFKSGSSRPDSVLMQGDEDRLPTRLEGSTCPSHFAPFDTSGLIRTSSDVEYRHCFEDQHTCQDTNGAQSAGFEAPVLSGNDKKNGKVGSSDKEALLECQRRSLLEEEQKIFASLERLDWKLAAINLRSMNVERESTASQGHYSTKSAPTIMGPCNAMEHFSLYAEKTVPFSLTPEKATRRRIPTGRQRCQVGQTNKTGRVQNVNRKK